MFFKTSLVSSLLALALYGYAQHQGWSLFANEARPLQSATSGTGRTGSGGHVYHK